MITLYSGTPGSGKSLHVNEVILRCLRLGRHVIANFPITFNKKEIKKGWDNRFFFWTNDQMNINNLLEFAIDHDYFTIKKESQCLVVYDEAGGKFNSREFGRSDRMEWIDFFSQHRKCGFDFILVAQSDKMLDRQIRGMVETEKKHRKTNNFGIFSFLPFPLFVAVEWWYTARQRVGSEFFFYKKSLGNRYDSMKMFEGFKLSSELMEKIIAKQEGRIHVSEDLQNPISVVYNSESED